MTETTQGFHKHEVSVRLIVTYNYKPMNREMWKPKQVIEYLLIVTSCFFSRLIDLKANVSAMSSR